MSTALSKTVLSKMALPTMASPTMASRTMAGRRLALLVIAALPALTGCSSSFWDRSPAAQGARVQGIFVRGPLADLNAPPAGPAVAGDWNKHPILTGDPDGLTGDPDGGGNGLSAARAVAVPGVHDLAALTEVNRLRAQHGLAPVRYEARLYAAAYAHSLEQMQEGYLGHDSRTPERATLGQRMQLERYVGRTYAEVVAKDFPDARSVVAAWMDSPRHREVLLDPDLSEAAFARVDGPANRTNRWTGDFADPGRSYTPIPAAAKPQPVAPPQVPSPATRVSVPPAAARSGTLPPARPPVPLSPAAMPVPSSQPRALPPPPSAPPSAPPSVSSSVPRVASQPADARRDGNIVPPVPGARASAPARPYVPPVAAAQPSAASPRASPPSAPRNTNVSPPYVASAPRAPQPNVAPPAAPRPTYRPAAPSRRPKDCKT